MVNWFHKRILDEERYTLEISLKNGCITMNTLVVPISNQLITSISVCNNVSQGVTEIWHMLLRYIITSILHFL